MTADDYMFVYDDESVEIPAGLNLKEWNDVFHALARTGNFFYCKEQMDFVAKKISDQLRKQIQIIKNK